MAAAARAAINDALMVGYQRVMALSALLALMASISAAVLIRGRSPDR